MLAELSVAVGCDTGKRRTNNEDNYFLHGRHLPQQHNGLPQVLACRYPLRENLYFAIFDGMGGEEAGERASYVAAKTLRRCLGQFQNLPPRDMLSAACDAMNASVCREMDLLPCGRMGTTVALLYVTPRAAYTCNLGDSRIYRLRNDTLLQLSTDDVEMIPGRRKTPLTQYLGIYPDELVLEPHIMKLELCSGDRFLLCSDGLSDLVPEREMCRRIMRHISARKCVDDLISEALCRGGTDNITAMMVQVR